jgi:hypothetical protein
MKPLLNKYTKYYNQLIESRKLLDRKFKSGCGFEKHHIVPKSLGGNNAKSNTVVLTPREHGLAHILLTRMYIGEAKGKMCYALIALSKNRNKHRTALTSREYESLRKAYYAIQQDPDYRALRSANTAKQWTPERRAAVAEKTRQQWITGPKREIYASAEYRTKKSKQMKHRWQNPNYIKEQSEKASAQWAEGGSLRDRSSKYSSCGTHLRPTKNPHSRNFGPGINKVQGVTPGSSSTL